ncbi:MAG: hypothetical protein ACNS60_09635 [Candidatus Cyclobacteriaceae bacterium M2_1C_046]
MNRFTKNSQRTLVSTFTGRTMPTHNQNLQKSFQVPALEKRNFKKCPTAQVDIENENKNEKKIKHESTTMAIRNAGFGAKLKVNEY